ncbi:bifunctional 2-polyprenyl-6-hydroxyphenol methylase/3-demethylubiquinol 3-O-methyltransferase UbiG [Rheinheimera aquimaris]|jgi:2-polyprenyl-6-hydroxyphenyl methylase/3-demethylubiquinone-9 3-methyltransferase|uniref:bifunctional 2-polyprenyl-6-hydroxyphenol methylase/3-demethylubiquinol 3-O-methyltransferase UbiG n=1 Tax=Rheinheimera aquimaris TaxID=412437 RepID=UPI000E95113F|nr:bifunctional 2-polyprenyl-6-hydroxyphenol methylase/3-demethylubiquinol 3-O-methyltransferase UbiG [Rheinheimera aquimaris]MCD1599436.1 bifunctional 2-polyprenyl-6-hydroxyphenol methylase/3-demethylubiquinol 3-O-methyltransferase UbiG [Rheinheimera aquimaris]HBN88987.1 bifunctional 3-demethylubiquinol 3-O-methyltransferase/2-polyprenyl-6-hydroxyphenol methylase [Rheinheimera sp.]|tara:strand:- start:30 stop:755 length:726 start_codon:yes stop_codon:yes gene_type:complete
MTADAKQPRVNVDPDEIAKFNDIASRWWDPDGEFKPLHLLNPVRLSYISDELQGLFGKTVIDIGCGGGILAESMARSGANVTGLDMAQDSLNVARLHALEAGVTLNYQQATAEQYAAEHGEQFDVVTCMEMLEHVPEPMSVIQACADLAKPGATLFFSTLNKTWKAYLLAIVGAEHIMKLVPKGTHEFSKFIRPSTLMRYLEQAGLEITDATGLHFNPVSNSFKTGPGLDVNYIVVARKPA